MQLMWGVNKQNGFWWASKRRRKIHRRPCDLIYLAIGRIHFRITK